MLVNPVRGFPSEPLHRMVEATYELFNYRHRRYLSVTQVRRRDGFCILYTNPADFEQADGFQAGSLGRISGSNSGNRWV